MEIGDQFYHAYQVDKLRYILDIDADRGQSESFLNKMNLALKQSFKQAGMAAPDFQDLEILSRKDLYDKETGYWAERIDGQHLCEVSIPLREEVPLSSLDEAGMDNRYTFDITARRAVEFALKALALDKPDMDLEFQEVAHEDQTYLCRFRIGERKPMTQCITYTIDF